MSSPSCTRPMIAVRRAPSTRLASAAGTRDGRERRMKLEGIHHITAITGDAVANVEFYRGVLGLRMVKKTVNQDDPTVYHLFYGDEHGSPGGELRCFEYPGTARGRAGAGMVHRIVWRVSSKESLGFWHERLSALGVDAELAPGNLLFTDHEGLQHELLATGTTAPPLASKAPGIPAEHALQGFDGVRVYAREPAGSAGLLGDTLGFARGEGDRWEVRGEQRGSFYAYAPAPEQTTALQGAGTVHHVAFAA